ncbi:MAG: hypothetical protein JWN67_4392 [Actinomycetia bacterium]|nr:hypothetical protein [Actinomycetes bacterium]
MSSSSQPIRKPPRNPEGQAKWRAAAAARSATEAPTSGDTGFDGASATTATFVVKVDGEEIGRFLEAQGLEVSIEVEELEEGGVNGYVHKLPGRMKWPNLTLKRGVTETNNLLAWINRCSGDGFTGEENVLPRSTLAVTLMSQTGTALRAWNFEGAFPVNWKGPGFATSEDALAMEELEITHHGFYVS